MNIEKIITAIKEGNFLEKVLIHVKYQLKIHRRLFYVSNENIRESIFQNLAYEKLKKEFSTIIKNADYSGLPQNECNKVWICWLQGYEQAPKLVKACIDSVKKNMPNHDVVILSDDNIGDYVKFPNHICIKYQEGKINRTHYSDLLRTELLCKYGGVWIDSTVLCTEEEFPRYICSLPLFVYKSIDLTRRDVTSTVASSWLIAAKSNQPIMLLTRDLLYAYWEKYDGLIDYFVFHLFFAMATQKFLKDWDAVPVFNNHSPHILQFELQNKYDKNRWKQIMKMSSFHKLNWHNDYSGFECSNYLHIIKEYVNIDAKIGDV